jgi:hypothetical protein
VRCTAWFTSVGVLKAVAQVSAVGMPEVVAFISKRMRSLELVCESNERARSVRIMLDGSEV